MLFSPVKNRKGKLMLNNWQELYQSPKPVSIKTHHSLNVCLYPDVYWIIVYGRITAGADNDHALRPSAEYEAMSHFISRDFEDIQRNYSRIYTNHVI